MITKYLKKLRIKLRIRYSILLDAKSNYISFRWLLMSTGDKNNIFLMNVNSNVKIYNANKFWYQKRLPIHTHRLGEFRNE